MTEEQGLGGERLKRTAWEGSRWKSILVNLCSEDHRRGFGPFEMENLDWGGNG